MGGSEFRVQGSGLAAMPQDCQCGLTLERYLLPVAQLGAREMLLRSLSPEYADGPLG